MHALEMAVGKAMRLYAAIFIGIGGLVLTVAWQHGPQRLLDAGEFATLTARHTGHVVESWLALEWDPALMGTSTRWRVFARATPCAVVEYDGDWGPARRAFCGNQLPFSESYTLHDLKEMAPKVPFAWSRDASGFDVPEIRLPANALAWLKAHPSDNFFLEKAKPGSALEDLRIELDRPVDSAVESWSTPAPVFPLALDPARPGEALPVGFVESRRDARPVWAVTVIAGAIGLVAWFSGMNIFLGFLVPAGRIVMGTVPLLVLPLWGDEFPHQLRRLDADIAGVIADMMGDIDITGRLVASDPESAAQAGGERVAWRITEGRYAETFGKIRFVLPKPAPADGDAALAALAATTASQVRAMAVPERIAIFERLKSDKLRDLRGAGFAFLPAAKEAVMDPGADPALRQAAAAFLSEWVVQPVEEVWPKDPGYRQRLQLLRELTAIPIPVIANPAGWILERGEKRK